MQLKINYVLDIYIPEELEDSISCGLDKKCLKRTLKDLDEGFMGGEDMTYDSKIEAIFLDNRITVTDDNYPI